MSDMNDVSAQIPDNVEEWTFDGTQGDIAARSWLSATDDPRYVAVLVHGYGEHIGRYDHVAAALIADGAVVYGLDHQGHGKSDGERVLVSNFDDVVTDLDRLVDQAQDVWPDLPLVMIGHSMGGMIAARYAQVHGEKLTALVLSAAVIGAFELIPQLLALDEMPDDPLPPEVLSRDPAVCEAYAADPLVWHGPFKRPTVVAMAAMIAAIDADASVGALPLMWVHGEEDQLVPMEGPRVGIEKLRGDSFRQHTYPGARHEVFNETNSDEVLADVTAFVDAVLDGDDI
jgi:alpha-beta hydrolase superfamily lysophospholipase